MMKKQISEGQKLQGKKTGRIGMQAGREVVDAGIDNLLAAVMGRVAISQAATTATIDQTPAQVVAALDAKVENRHMNLAIQVMLMISQLGQDFAEQARIEEEAKAEADAAASKKMDEKIELRKAYLKKKVKILAILLDELNATRRTEETNDVKARVVSAELSMKSDEI